MEQRYPYNTPIKLDGAPAHVTFIRQFTALKENYTRILTVCYITLDDGGIFMGTTVKNPKDDDNSALAQRTAYKRCIKKAMQLNSPLTIAKCLGVPTNNNLFKWGSKADPAKTESYIVKYMRQLLFKSAATQGYISGGSREFLDKQYKKLFQQYADMHSLYEAGKATWDDVELLCNRAIDASRMLDHWIIWNTDCVCSPDENHPVTCESCNARNRLANAHYEALF